MLRAAFFPGLSFLPIFKLKTGSSEAFAKVSSDALFPLLRNSVFSEDYNASKMIKDTP